MEKHQYIIRETYDGNSYHTLATVNSMAEVDSWIAKAASRDGERELTIYRQTVSEVLIDIRTVPMYVPTVEEIAEEIIGYSDGSFVIEWGEDYDKLEKHDQDRVEELVHESIGDCAVCGWNYHVDSLSEHHKHDGSVCWRCYEDLDEKDEEESDED
jgi:hypothetical protein